MLLDEDQTSPAAALLQSLSMLTQAVGRERTLSQYTSLLQAAGFERVSGVKTGAYLDAVLAEKRGVLPSPGGSDRNT
jgi:O-methyltransferase domain